MSLTIDRPTYQRATVLEMVARSASAPALPAGVIGQVEGVALVYDVIDDRDTTFARGCLDRTVRERVSSGKVRLFMDHGDLLTSGTYDTHLHIGVVREVWDTLLPDGTTGAKFRADIFDTDAGRAAHEYLRAIAATGSETGVSIGMLRAPVTVRTTLNGQACGRINEVALGEISITAMSAVPGTHVTHVRTAVDYRPLLTGICAALGPDEFRALVEGITGNAQPTDSDAASGAPAPADSDASPADSQPAAIDAAAPTIAYAERLLRMRRLLMELSS